MAVIELKKSSVSVSNGIRQNLTNQKDGFIAPFFTTMQFCMAGNETEGLRYGTILTGEKYYMEWKPDGFHENEDERDPEDARIMAYCEKLDNLLLQQIYQMFDKKRFIDLIENFVVYDKGIKKVCRYNQFYGIKRTQRRLAKQRGGIIWHTQGSGKTLTMVWLSKWILANCEEENPRVLIVTDRDMIPDFANACLNVLLFIPFGFFLPTLWEKFRNVKSTIVAGLLTTLFIEISQLFTGRATDIDDVITNILGTIIGYHIAYWFTKAFTGRVLENSKQSDFNLISFIVF